MNAEQLKNSILQRAIEGKLVEQRPEEGTAAELLREIKVEKARLVKEGKIKKEKPLPEIKEEEIPFEIPESWEWVRLGDVFNLQAGKNIVSAEIHETQNKQHPYPCYGGNGLRGYVSTFNRKGDYPLIGRQGALCGNINFASNIFYATEHAVVVETYCNTSVKWAGLFLKALNLNQYATATAQPGLAVRTINQVIIPLPPLAEQKRIVAKIEELLPHVEQYGKAHDELTALNEKFPDAMKKSVLQYAMEGKLVEQREEEGTAKELLSAIKAEKARLVVEGKLKKEKPLPEIKAEEIPFEIPESWEWVRFGEIVNTVSARRVHQSDWKNNGIPFYRAREIAILADKNYVDNELYISEELYNDLSQSGIPKPNDLMITAVGTLGKTYIVKENDKFYYKDASVISLQNYGNLCAEYLKAFIESPCMRTQINSNSSGTTVATLTIIRMNHYLIPLPPLAEQKRIVAKIEELLACCGALEKA